MGFERVAIFGLIDVDIESTGTGTLTLSTDLPGVALSVRESKGITPTSRRTIRFRLQGTTKGHLYSVKIAPAAGCLMRLYGARIWARVLPGGAWQWYQVPLIETPAEFTPVKLPIPETGDWSPAKLPIPPTPEDWTPAALPIPQTPQEFSSVQLPIKPTPANPEWANIEVDQ